MSAPQIPNLNTLRRGGPGAAVRMRGRGSGVSSDVDSHLGIVSSPAQNVPTQADKDAIVQRTDFDAASSRLSCVEAGYLDDPFAKLMMPPGTEEAPRRLPLMNRGTYARTSAIDRLVESFLESASTLGEPGLPRRQIISLGAGSDTRFFRMRARYKGVVLRYHEVDFEENIAVKIQQIRSTPFVRQAQGIYGLDVGREEVHRLPQDRPGLARTKSGCYLHALDLRNVSRAAPGLSGTPFRLPYVEPDIPTLLMSECCLIYLPPHDADRVLEVFSNMLEHTTPIGIVIYEPIRPHDAFGKTMVANLTARGIHLQTLKKYDSLEKQQMRMKAFVSAYRSRDGIEAVDEGVGVMDLDFMWNRWLDKEEKERVLGLEFMDEVEEFVLLMEHYCIAWAWREDANEADGTAAFSGWKALPGQLSNG